MGKAYIGIDLAAKYCWGATVDQKGELLSLEKFKTGEGGLIAYVRKQKGERTVPLEECDLAGWAQRVLMPYAGKVAVCDPKFNLWVHRDTAKTTRSTPRSSPRSPCWAHTRRSTTPPTRGSISSIWRSRTTAAW